MPPASGNSRTLALHVQGYHGDTSRMFGVGKMSKQAQELCDATLEALETAITQCGPGVPFRIIGQVTLLSHTKEPCIDVECQA